MTVYAASSLGAVNLSVEGHGGCGQVHSRPTPDGAPVKVWALDCPQCENHLRHDPLWSSTVIEIPETYDETKAREQSEKSGKMDRERQLAEALIQLGPLGDLPKALGQVLAQLIGPNAAPGALAGQMECQQGHPNPAGMKFCGECGSPMSQPVAAAAITAPQEAAEPPAQSPAPQRRRLRDARLEELQALAVARNIDPVGTRADLIVKLSNAGVTNNDLARMPVAA